MSNRGYEEQMFMLFLVTTFDFSISSGNGVPAEDLRRKNTSYQL